MAFARRLSLLMLLTGILCVSARTASEKEAMQKAVRMKTSRQLKEIFDELGISHKGLDKEGLRKKAYKEDAVGRWEKLHPEKKKAPRSSGPGGGGGFGGNSYGKAPDGMEQDKWEDLMAQMKGDFSREADPERRRLLEKLSKSGMSFGGGSSMTTEQLRNMAKILDDMPNFKDKAGAGGGMGADDAAPRAEPAPGDDDIAEEDKMELTSTTVSHAQASRV